MTDKTKLQTLKHITQNKNFIDLMKNGSQLKERHNGLTIKFSQADIDKSSKDKLEPNQTTLANDVEKKENNYQQYKYGILTNVGNKKINKITKNIFNLEARMKIELEKNKKLENEFLNMEKDLRKKENQFQNIDKEIKMLDKQINENKTKNIKNTTYNLKKYFSLKYEKQELMKLGLDLTHKIQEMKKNIEQNNKIITKWEHRINQFEQKKLEETENLNVPLSLKDKINKKIELQKELYENEILEENEKERLINNIVMLDKQMITEVNKNNKDVKKIYEEILPVDDNIYFITTFIYADESIAEEVLYFYCLENNEIELFKQRKNYKTINEYKNDLSLINENNADENIIANTIPIKEFLSELETKKSKISKTELIIYVLIFFISISFSVIPVVLLSAMLGKVIGVVASLIISKILWAIAEDKTKKITALMKKSIYSWIRKIPIFKDFGKSKEEKESKKKVEELITKLKNEKLETKLATQFSILKEKLDNNKNNNANELFDNSNNQKRLKINEINALDLKNQPSTSKGMGMSSKLCN